MKRYLAGAAVAGCLFAIGAGTAGAKASFDFQSQSGFISRGDVIAAGGKDALVANPVVSFTMTTRLQLSCTWADSTRRSTTGNSTFLLVYRAETRYSGNGTITGYILARDDEFDSEITSPFDNPAATCWAMRGIANNGMALEADVTPLGTTSELTFFGPAGGFDLGF